MIGPPPAKAARVALGALSVAIVVVASSLGCSSPSGRRPSGAATTTAAATSVSGATRVCGLLAVADVESQTALRVRSHSATAVSENAANCRWLLDPSPNAVFLNVAAPSPGVGLAELFRASTQGIAGGPVPGLGESSWQGSGPDDGLVVVKGGYVLKLTVQGAGSGGNIRSRADNERVAQQLATRLLDRM